MCLGNKLPARRAAAAERAGDAIDEAASPVIIAGFGRFGQIVGRLLFASGIRAIVLDHDPEQVDLLRKFGYKVFYGATQRGSTCCAPPGRQTRGSWSTRSTTLATVSR